MIKFRNVKKEYKNGVLALADVNLDINKGDFIYLIGPSGAGKSTFLKLLYREEKPTNGHIYVGEEEVNKIWNYKLHKYRRKLGVVFQDFKLLQNMTVYENIAFSLEVLGLSKKEIRKRVVRVLEVVNLKNKVKYYPNQLSGGEQQRVSIARAIVNNPSVLICDEPTGNLDPDTSVEIMHVLEKINKLGTTIIMATHDKDIVNKMRHRVISIEYGHVIRDQQEGVYHYD